MWLLILQVLVPYMALKVQDAMRNVDWANPQNARRGTSILNKLKYLVARLFRIVMQFSKVAELLNFLGFMT